MPEISKINLRDQLSAIARKHFSLPFVESVVWPSQVTYLAEEAFRLGWDGQPDRRLDCRVIRKCLELLHGVGAVTEDEPAIEDERPSSKTRSWRLVAFNHGGRVAIEEASEGAYHGWLRAVVVHGVRAELTGADVLDRYWDLAMRSSREGELIDVGAVPV